MENKLRVDEWEILANYGTHRICRECYNLSVTNGYILECSIKKTMCRSGFVKPNHACKHWEAKKYG